MGVDKVHLNFDCMNGRIVNGCRQPILFSYPIFSPRGHKIMKEPRIKLFEKVNKSVLCHLTFYLEDDDQKPVDFNEEMISFTCQLIEKY